MSLDELRAQCLNCKKCGLCETRNNVVFGIGNPKSKVLFIGEGPGENEDLQGKPFVGRGGMLLDKMLAVVDLSREKNIYIANMVKCRPPKNRDPEETEVAACRPWLEEQIRISKDVMHSCKVSEDVHKLVKGLMIESYIEDGAQKVSEHCYGKSITDPCLGWEKTEKLIYELAELW